jgi:membrane protein implicated in regulation of membrane protease activity
MPWRRDAVTTTFLIVGGFGLLMLAGSVFHGGHLHFGHVHFHLPSRLHIGHSTHPSTEAALSLPSVAGFIGAFGFGGAIAAQLLDSRSAVVPSLIGVLAAIPTAWLAARLTRAAMEMHTDATPTRLDVIGSLGVVIRAIPEQGFGEVRVAFAGQLMKYHARAAESLPAGTRILVIDAPSSTSVVVESATHLLD